MEGTYQERKSFPFTVAGRLKTPHQQQESPRDMSPVAKFLLRNCDNDLRINLRDAAIAASMHKLLIGYTRAKVVALFLGVTLVGGS